jgi:hypothetical protein
VAPVKATWESDRRGISTQCISDAQGDRLALCEGQEDMYLLEGPTGWSRLDQPPPLQVKVWGRGDPGDTTESGV